MSVNEVSTMKIETFDKVKTFSSQMWLRRSVIIPQKKIHQLTLFFIIQAKRTKKNEASWVE